MSDEILKVEQVGDLHLVTLNRPDRLNALNQPMAEALLAYFEARRRDKSVRVIVLRAEGRAFCSGADLKASGDDRLRDGAEGDWTLRDLMKAMRACPQPIVSLVQGAAAGGGMAIALSSDIIVCSEDAVFHPAFLKIGLSGAELGVSWRLQRTMGAMRAREFLLTSRPMGAVEALSSGMISAVTTRDNLDAKGREMADAMLAGTPDALRITKRSLDFALEAASFDTAMEIEERGQMIMIGRRMRAATPA